MNTHKHFSYYIRVLIDPTEKVNLSSVPSFGLGTAQLAPDPVLSLLSKDPWGKESLELQSKMNIQVIYKSQTIIIQVNQEKHHTRQKTLRLALSLH